MTSDDQQPPTPFQRLSRLVETAYRHPPGKRLEWLRTRCGDDTQLFTEAMRLLSVEVNGFMEQSPLEAAPPRPKPLFDPSSE